MGKGGRPEGRAKDRGREEGEYVYFLCIVFMKFMKSVK